MDIMKVIDVYQAEFLEWRLNNTFIFLIQKGEGAQTLKIIDPLVSRGSYTNSY